MPGKYVYQLSSPDLPTSIGNKAANLFRLKKHGFKIPTTYICNWQAYLDYQDAGEMVMQTIEDQLAHSLDPNRSYAVRSSVNLEDGQDYSFAGQFSTILNVSSLGALSDAIRQVWDSSNAEEVSAYRQRIAGGDFDLKVAVIIQEMVQPFLSGVVFSKNPITGLEEILIEAVDGPGTALVQRGVTPLRWIYKWDGWFESPKERQDLQDLVQQIVDQTKVLVQKTGKDIDLEWVYDGADLYWLQLREITTLGDVQIYSNKIAKEFLPGLIKPLVWSVNIPLVNGAWVRLIREAIGEIDLDPERMARAFHYRAYFDMSAFAKIFDRLGLPRESLEINMGIVAPPTERPKFRPNKQMLTLLPRLARFLAAKWRFSRQIEKEFPRLEAKFKSIERLQTAGFSLSDLIDQIDQLRQIVQQAAYFNIVVPLLMYFYNGGLRRLLQAYDIAFEDINLTHDMEEMLAYDPNFHLARLQRGYRRLSPTMQELIRVEGYQAFFQGESIFQKEVDEFIDQFGYISDSGNDFSAPPWREDKDLVLRLIVDYQPPPDKQERGLDPGALPIKGIHRWRFRLFYHRARAYQYYREWISAAYTQGYGLFRKFFLAIGAQMVTLGRLNSAQDIFYLYEAEIRQVIESDADDLDLIGLVAQRKKDIERAYNIELPDVIYGDQAPPMVSSLESTLLGTPTSGGVYRGPVKVVNGIQDFKKLNDGDVLVIPYSDVGWTPLFTRAGAVIAESGGILSHSSIVAREYGIPAVVSVPGALKLEDNIFVTVDGYRGVIILPDPQEAPTAPFINQSGEGSESG